MARWVLGCSNCKVDFTHAEILQEQRSLDPFLRNTPKPELPRGGLTLICPNCGKSSVYQRYQLIYQSA
jgi:uncharacterized protein (DUF983 family)